MDVNRLLTEMMLQLHSQPVDDGGLLRPHNLLKNVNIASCEVDLP